eukprot:m.167480 g.167480  ORF g.167480 m.167480 type:complete len:51 (+) comp14729_c0_seq4:4280-4432(+)
MLLTADIEILNDRITLEFNCLGLRRCGRSCSQAQSEALAPFRHNPLNRNG